MDAIARELRRHISTENIANYGNAVIAHAHAKRGKKSYRQIRAFEENQEENLRQLVREFTDGTYRTTGYEVTTISDGKKDRIVAKVPYRDRVAQWMLAIWYEPYFQRIICNHTHAAIKGRGAHSALRQVEHYVRRDKYEYCLKLDIRKYFPHVDRQILLDIIREDFPDRNIYTIVANIIRDAPDSVADVFGNVIPDGIPIGNYWSQFMANRYMVPLTEWFEANNVVFVQYMDDIVILSHDKQDLRRIYFELEWELLKLLNLTIKHNWQIFPVTRGIDFVGYRIFPNKTTLRRSNYLDMRRKMARMLKHLRNDGIFTESMKCSVMSYLGGLCHCTKGTRLYIYDTIFAEIIRLSGLQLSRKLARYYDCQN